MKFIQIIIISLMLIEVRPVIGLNQWNLTLHTVQENWNDASVICRRHGGRLAQLRTDWQVQIFQKLLNLPPWADLVGNSTFIGLAWSHQSNRFEWISCKNGSKSIDLPVKDGMCGAWDVFSSSPYATSCFTQRMAFVCQSSNEGTECAIEQHRGKVPHDSEGLTKTQANQANTARKCYRACNKAGTNCLAFSFTNATRACQLYEHKDPIQFLQGINMTIDDSTDTYVKDCFHVHVYSDSHLVRHGAALTPYRWPCQGRGNKQKIIYTFHLQHSTWHEAKQICESMGHSLAEFDSSSKILVVPQLMFDFSSQLYWSGFRYTEDDITWMDSDVPVNPKPDIGALTKGNSSCGATLMPDMLNYLEPCTSSLPFVCQRKRDVKQCGIHITRQALLQGNLVTAQSDNSEVVAEDILRNPQGSHCFSCPTSSDQPCFLFNTSSWEECFSGDNKNLNSTDTSTGWSIYRTSCYSVVEWKDDEFSGSVTATSETHTSDNTKINSFEDTTSLPTFSVTTESYINTAPNDITSLTDNVTTPNDIVTISSDTLTTPNEIANKASDIITSLTDNVTTPNDIITTSSDTLTTPNEIANKASDIITSFTENVTTPNDIITTSSDTLTTPNEIANKASDIITSFTENVTTPNDIINTSSDTFTTPNEIANEGSDIITSFTENVTTPNDIITTSGNDSINNSDTFHPIETQTEETSPQFYSTDVGAVSEESTNIAHTMGSEHFVTDSYPYFSTETQAEETSPLFHSTHAIETDDLASSTSSLPTQEPLLDQTHTSTEEASAYIVSSTELTHSLEISTTSTPVWYGSSLSRFSLCECTCSNTSLRIDISSNRVEFTQFIEELSGFSNNASSASRRKECAEDSRTSSVCIGLIATAVMTSFFTILIVSDSYYLFMVVHRLVSSRLKFE